MNAPRQPKGLSQTHSRKLKLNFIFLFEMKLNLRKRSHSIGMTSANSIRHRVQMVAFPRSLRPAQRAARKVLHFTINVILAHIRDTRATRCFHSTHKRCNIFRFENVFFCTETMAKMVNDNNLPAILFHSNGFGRLTAMFLPEFSLLKMRKMCAHLDTHETPFLRSSQTLFRRIRQPHSTTAYRSYLSATPCGRVRVCFERLILLLFICCCCSHHAQTKRKKKLVDEKIKRDRELMKWYEFTTK